jgi:hypothetical protein
MNWSWQIAPKKNLVGPADFLLGLDVGVVVGQGEEPIVLQQVVDDVLELARVPALQKLENRFSPRIGGEISILKLPTPSILDKTLTLFKC